MASKQNILLHLDGINACSLKEYEHALGLFQRITEPSAPIFFNMGCCYLRLEDNHSALKMFDECVAKDKYLALGHFQLAVAQTLCGDRQSAITSFMEAFKALRGNAFINYKQLNNSCKLYAFDINFNIALLHFFSGDNGQAQSYLRAASSVNTSNSARSLVNEALTNLESGFWDYFGQSPVDRLRNLKEDCFFHPSKAKLEGIQAPTKFMDTAKVVSASKDEYSFVGFVGAKNNPVSHSPNPQSHSTPTNKRPSPPSAPPPPVPHVPPPRLPPDIPQPLRSLPAPTPIRPTSQNRSASPTASPSRPPPPSIPAPKPNKPFEENAEARTTPTNAVNDFKKSLDNNLKGRSNLHGLSENAMHKLPNYSNVGKISPAKTVIELDCKLTLFVDGEPMYPEIIRKISEQLSRISSELSNSGLEGKVSLTYDNPHSANVQIDVGTWQNTWAEIKKNRPHTPKLVLKDGNGASEKPKLSPRPKSPYKSSPSRSPNNFLQQYKNAIETQVEDEEVYADHLVLSVQSPG